MHGNHVFISETGVDPPLPPSRFCVLTKKFCKTKTDEEKKANPLDPCLPFLYNTDDLTTAKKIENEKWKKYYDVQKNRKRKVGQIQTF